ncbi:methyltransferase family protein [Celeribacter sp. ULVN23_4]
MKHLDYPSIWLLGFLTLTWGCAEAGLAIPSPVWLKTLGGLLIAVGLGLMGPVVVPMWRHHTTVVPHRVPSDIVTDGVCRLSRNPICLGDAFTLAGFALLCGSPAGMLMSPVFMAVIQRWFIVEEERWLRTKFPREFQTWAQHTRRWL